MNQPLPDAATRIEALDLGQHVLAVAPAGSGKTSLLVRRMLRALATVARPEQVVAITFTNKAAAEIRHRIISLLQRAAEDDSPRDAVDADALADARAVIAQDARLGWQLRAQPSRLAACTIDSFNAQLAAQLPLLSGLGGNVRTTDDPQSLYEQAVLDLFARLDDDDLAETDRQALAQVLRLTHNRLDTLLPPLCDLLARREQWLPTIISGQWREREQALLHQLCTQTCDRLIHLLDADARSTLLTCLQAAATQERGDDCRFAIALTQWPGPETLEVWRALAAVLLTKTGTLRRKIDVRSGFPPKQPHSTAMNALLKSWADHQTLESALVAVQRLPDLEHASAYGELRDALLRVLHLLSGHLRLVFGERAEVDFAEVALAAQQALSGDGVGQALLNADRNIQHLLVDEMQDTSDTQIQLLHRLTSGWQPDDGHSLFLVGDPQQSIYAFRKAEVSLFQQLMASGKLGVLPLRVLRLTANFRSAPPLVDWFNEQFTRIFPVQDDRNIGAVSYTESRACAPAPPQSHIALHCWLDGDRQHEARHTAAIAAERLAQCRREGRDASVAILVRVRAHLAETLAALRAAGLQPRCTDMDPLISLPAVSDVVAAARALWHPEDRLHWARLLRAPFVGLSWADLVALSRGRIQLSWPQRLREADSAPLSDEGRQRVQRLVNALQQVDANSTLRPQLADRCEALWHALNGPACVTPQELADVQATLRLLRSHCSQGEFNDLPAFERALALLFAAPGGEGIEVMTIHKAKGLEFDHVVLPALNRSPRRDDHPLIQLRTVATPTMTGELLALKPPSYWPGDEPQTLAAQRFYDYLCAQQAQAQDQEARRLLYVAATRARRSLTLLCTTDSDDQGQPMLLAHSFAKLLEAAWPVFTRVTAAPDTPDAALDATPPISPRLPLTTPSPAWQTLDLYRPREQRTQKPSEAVLHTIENKRDNENIYAQQVGTLLHQALEKISHEGLDAWADHGVSRRHSLAAGLRHAGVPEPQVTTAVDRILTLLDRILSSPTGRWLLSPKSWAASEYALSSYRKGHWISAVIDRCFEDEDGNFWVIDYKTTAHPIAADAMAHYLAQSTEHFRPQLTLYRELLALERPGQTIRAALYFVEADQLVELTMQ